MNYFAHGRAFVDDPWFLAGTAVPDWLNVSDRGARVRAKHAQALVDDPDPVVAALARGIAQHHRDDAWFHETAAFGELCWRFTAQLRELLAPDAGLRPSFLGHILVEILLDATLVADDPQRLRQYYQAIDSLDPAAVEAAVNRMAPRPAVRLAQLLPLFVSEGFLWDYADDGKLCYRLNQVMRRVRLPAVPGVLRKFLPQARQEVTARKGDLLARPPASGAHQPTSAPHRSPS
ncbi:MAG: hypothetical protein HYX69_12140 [Planctomycetia bacterium]|nr:hypothetical protein [Planctomycetia bacterium]